VKRCNPAEPAGEIFLKVDADVKYKSRLFRALPENSLPRVYGDTLQRPKELTTGTPSSDNG